VRPRRLGHRVNAHYLRAREYAATVNDETRGWLSYEVLDRNQDPFERNRV
jgi:hypothetical protein